MLGAFLVAGICCTPLMSFFNFKRTSKANPMLDNTYYGYNPFPSYSYFYTPFEYR
jgi:hypothetical protein